ncbi:hypothetical protein GCM10023192_07650 [Amycolatopsis samaneae]
MFLRELTEKTVGGSGGSVLVDGGLASGKTQLLNEFLEEAGKADVQLLTASGAKMETGLQMGVVDQLFRGIGLPAGLTEGISRMLTECSAGAGCERRDECAIETLGVSTVREVCAALLELARTCPVVIAVDDLHHADRWSLRQFLYVQRRIRSAPILMVFTEWDRPDPEVAWFRSEFTRHPHHRFRLPAWSEKSIAELVAKTADPGAASFAAEFRRLSGGNPMLVNALVEDSWGGEAGGPPVAGPAFGQAVLACLHRWEPELLTVAQAVAILRDDATLDLVGRLAGIQAEGARQVIDVLTAAGLLTAACRFRHEVAEVAVLDSLSGPERARLRVRAGELLFWQGFSAERVARYLLAADQVPASWGVGVLCDAAAVALAGDDISLGRRYLELALTAAVDDDEQIKITKVLAQATWRVNPSAAAPYVARLRDAVLAGTLAGDDVVTVVRHSLWQGDGETTVKALDLLNGSADSSSAQVEAELRLAYEWSYGSSHGRFSDVTSESGRDPWASAANVLARLWTDGGSEPATASAEHVLQSCRLGDTTLEAVGIAILALVYGGKGDRAAWWCERLIEEADRRRAVTWQAMLGTIRAGLSLRRGEADTAARQVKAAFELLPARSWGVLIGYPLTTSLLANTELGRFDVAAELVRQPVPEAMFATLGGLRYLHARGRYHLRTERVLAAISDFQRCGLLMRERELDMPMLVAWRTDLAEANLLLGRTTVARDLARQQLDHPRALDSRTQGITLRVLAAASPVPDRPVMLKQAIECLQAAGDRLELAKTLTALSATCQELGEFDRARLLARRAAQELKFCHAGAPAPDDVAPETGEPDGSTAEDLEPPLLSGAERRVAELAALGHTNREIGRQLFVTVSTVEQHLTRIYRKLGVTSRSDLPGRLDD